jgi:hypothetical protein
MQYVIALATGIYGYVSNPKGGREQESFGSTAVECTAVSC